MFEGIGKGITLQSGLRWVSTLFQSGTSGNSAQLDLALTNGVQELKVYGFCSQSGTPTAVNPVPIVCNNGEIVGSKNMCNVTADTVVVGKYINNSGVETSDTANFYCAAFIPVTPGGTYTMATSSSIWYFSVMQYDSSNNFLRRSIWGATNTPVGTEKTFSVGADCYYIRFGSNMRKATISLADVLAVDWMLVSGSSSEPYTAYGVWDVVGTSEVVTVSAIGETDIDLAVANLYAVGDAVDEQNINGGSIERKCAVCVYDGTQNVGNTFISSTGGKDFLAVIVYPLAISESESVSPQPINNTGGNITISANKTNTFNRNLFDGHYKKAIL